jgi:hypothetical protein
MLCLLFSLLQIFVPEAAALAVDVQARALLLSCGVFAFIVYRVSRGRSHAEKAYKLGC